MKRALIFSIILLLSCCQLSYANSDKVQNEMESHIEGVNQKNLEKAMASIHPLSPQHGAFLRVIRQGFQNYDLSTELEDFNYVGRSGDYAIVKIIYNIIRKSGAPYKDNKQTSFYIFKRQSDEWKIWTFVTVNMEPLS